VIEIQNLGKKFNSEWIFKDICLEVAHQESVVLIGPSGGGKSVFLKIVAGLLTADCGTLQIKSKNLGMLFQKNALFDSFTVEENLLFPLRERLGVQGRAAKEKASRFLEAVGLGIARALIVEPELILYDEPTAGLDPITSKTIADLIISLRTQFKSTLLTVTNDMHRAYQLGDRICLLAQGKLISGGTPQEVRLSTHAGLRQFIYGLKNGPLTSGLT
jgi:phospholipid/cholesterol/gamma-HCH transport system ATP-binding protein